MERSFKVCYSRGDHNCIHRKEDSVNNPGQCLQQGLIKHLKINGLKDSFLVCHGVDKIEFSRVTNISATRIDYIFSNLKDCKRFEYLKLRGLDHKAGIAFFDIEFERDKEQIPKEKMFRAWVIDKELYKDREFLERVDRLYALAKDDIVERETIGDDPDIAEYWETVKREVIIIAKEREQEKRIKNVEERISSKACMHI